MLLKQIQHNDYTVLFLVRDGNGPGRVLPYAGWCGSDFMWVQCGLQVDTK